MRWGLRILAAVVVLVGIAATILVSTEFGLKLAQRSLNHIPGLSIASAAGRMGSHFILKQLRYESASSEFRLAHLEVTWNPWQLLGGKLHVSAISGQGLEILGREEEEKSKADAQQPSVDSGRLPVLPLSVAIDQLSLQGMRFVASDGDDLLAFTRIVLQFRENNGLIEIPQLVIDGPEMGYDVHGSIDLGQDSSINILGSWHIAGFGFLPSHGSLSVAGPLNTPDVHVELDSPAAINVNGRFTQLLSEPKWTATLGAENVDLSAWIISCPQIILHKVHGDLHGDFGHYRGRVTADGAWQGLDQLHLVTDIDGDGYGIKFTSQQVTRKDGVANGYDASINWRNIFGWEGRFDAVNFDLATLDLGLNGLLNGRFSSNGEVLDDGLLVSFAIEDISGTVQNQPVRLNGDVQLTEKGVQTDNLVLHSGEYDGTATFHWASFDWTPKLCWSTDIELDHFSPASLLPAIQGEVSTVLESEGCLKSDGPEGYLRLHTVQGELNNNELWGGGEIRVSGTEFSSPGLQLQAGPNIFKIKGTAGNTLGLEFSLASSDIGTLIPGSKGSLHGFGLLNGDPKGPKVDMKLEGYNLVYGAIDVGYSGVHLAGVLNRDAQIEGLATIENLAAGSVSVDDAELRVHGSLSEHDLYLSGENDQAELEIQLHGTYDDSWRTSVTTLHFSDERFGTWEQKGQTSIELSGENAKVSDLCLKEEEGGELCLRSKLQFSEYLPWTIALDGNNLALDWMRRWQLADLPVSGNVVVQVRAQGDKKEINDASIVAYVGRAEIVIPTTDNDSTTIKFTDGRLTSQLIGKELTTDITLSTSTGGEVDFAVSLGGVGTFADFSAIPRNGTLDGELRIQDFDIAFLSAATGYWLQPKGKLHTALKIGGTILQPRLQGTGFVRDGGLVLPDQGVEFSDIQFRLDGQSDVLKIHSRVSSGPGESVAEGEIRFKDGDVAVEMQLHGENFLIVELPEYVFRIDPVLQFSYAKGVAKVEGDVKVAHGLITPEEIKNATTASNDVVFINDFGEEEKSGLPVLLNLRVRLGDDVKINGYGLKGKLKGQLQINTNSSGLITGKGEVDLVDGTFTVYGRSLDIARGRVLFNGGPIDNPGVDIRAQKTVSEEQAKSKGYTVGVDIGGLVQDLQYQLFSDPAMDDTEILSLMVVGHSLANTSSEEGNMLMSAAETLGLGTSAKFVESIGEVFTLDDLHIEGSSQDEDMSLVVGKKITKDLYIGYDVNMFSQLGQFRVRYDLKHGFWVETKSSSEATGADLFYSFKR